MNTTYLLIELLIAGFLFFLSLIPFAVLILGYELESVLTFHLSIYWPYQILAAYSAGIVWNRICDEIYSYFENKIILSKFNSKEDYISARLKVILHGAPVKNYLETLRSLLRVSRVFSITSVIYSISVPFFLLGLNDMPPSQILLIMIILILFTIASIYAWYKFQRSYIKVVFYSCEHIKEDEKRGFQLQAVKSRKNYKGIRVN